RLMKRWLPQEQGSDTRVPASLLCGTMHRRLGAFVMGTPGRANGPAGAAFVTGSALPPRSAFGSAAPGPALAVWAACAPWGNFEGHAPTGGETVSKLALRLDQSGETHQTRLEPRPRR